MSVAALLLLLSGLSSCSFLADEFTWLDRAGPVADPLREPDRSATFDRP